MSDTGWIGVDLDGTLAMYDGWKGVDHIGDPVIPMLILVKGWIEQGQEVRIFTARVSDYDRELSKWDKKRVEENIWDWCEKHGLPRLEITCHKDMRMVMLYDDRCVQVERNTGRLIQ